MLIYVLIFAWVAVSNDKPPERDQSKGKRSATGTCIVIKVVLNMNSLYHIIYHMTISSGLACPGLAGPCKTT